MKVTEIKNDHGYWLDIEEEVSEYHEGSFRKDGFYLDDKLVFTWERSDEIRKELEGYVKCSDCSRRNVDCPIDYSVHGCTQGRKK